MSKKKIYVDIDDTICFYKKGVKAGGSSYPNAKPSYENISKINKLYEEGHFIKYYTARGATSGIDYFSLTEKQLKQWGAKYHELSTGEKPPYDLLICDKTKRIEEI